MAIVFTFPDYEGLAKKIAEGISAKQGKITIRNFPDGESYIKIDTEIKDQEVLVVCGLDKPDSKIMMLISFAVTAKEIGASRVGIIAPYLGYMRQDKRFQDGEAVTSNIFAELLSKYFDFLVTVDPHLHRHKSLNDIYSLDGMVVHAANVIAKWIQTNINKPLLIGPDEESRQWVADIASNAGAPFTILNKVRRGDNEVEVSVPDIEKYQDNTPVLVDDIISTAHTMLETVKHLHKAKMHPPVCIAIHAVFAPGAYDNLLNANVKQVITCNTITHPSNGLDISQIIIDALNNGYYSKKNVFFEVGAVLHQEEKSNQLGWNALQDTINGTGNYNQNNYGLDREISFNPLTNQKATDKYVTYKHKNAEIYKNIDQLKRLQNALKHKKLLIIASLKRIKKDFSEVIHSMVKNHLDDSKKLDVHKNEHPTSLSNKEVNKSADYESTVKARYDVHPHVDALLNERKQQLYDHNRAK